MSIVSSAQNQPSSVRSGILLLRHAMSLLTDLVIFVGGGFYKHAAPLALEKRR